MSYTFQSGMYGVIPAAKGTFCNGTGSTISKGTLVKFDTTLSYITPATDGTTNFGDPAIGVADVDIPSKQWGMITMLGGCEVIAGATAFTAPGTWFKSDSAGRAIPLSQAKDIPVGYTIGISSQAGDVIAAFFIKNAIYYTA